MATVVALLESMIRVEYADSSVPPDEEEERRCSYFLVLGLVGIPFMEGGFILCSEDSSKLTELSLRFFLGGGLGVVVLPVVGIMAWWWL